MALLRRRRRVDHAVVELREEAPKLVWGRPSRCPACGGPGYLDHIDPTLRVMQQHCPTCSARWTVAESECV